MPDMLHDPQAVLDYKFEWSTWLQTDEVIVGRTVTVDTPGLAVDSTSVIGGDVIAWLSGGTDGANYRVTCHVTTDQGRQDDRTLTIRCRNR